MLSIDLGKVEYYNSENNTFLVEDLGVVRFEYSLKALYDWEGVWRKPFLKGDLNEEELFDFFRKMALDPIEDKHISPSVQKKLSDYIQTSHTATTFSNEGGSKKSGKVHTAEEFYALMANANVPLEFENRNLNRLLDILKIISSYQTPPKKMSKEDIFKQNAKLNEARKKQLGTKG